MWDELDEPLGFAPGAAAAPPVRRRHPTKGAAAGVAIVAAAVGLAAFPRGVSSRNGEPFAVAKVEATPAPRKSDAPDVTASVGQTLAPAIASAEQVEAKSGVKVTRGMGAPPKALIIDVQRALGAKGPSSQSNPSANP